MQPASPWPRLDEVSALVLPGGGRHALAGLARLSIATVGGCLLAQTSALGTDGHFLGVALGITAYGLITASGVRPAVWRMSRP